MLVWVDSALSHWQSPRTLCTLLNAGLHAFRVPSLPRRHTISHCVNGVHPVCGSSPMPVCLTDAILCCSFPFLASCEYAPHAVHMRSASNFTFCTRSLHTNTLDSLCAAHRGCVLDVTYFMMRVRAQGYLSYMMRCDDQSVT